MLSNLLIHTWRDYMTEEELEIRAAAHGLGSTGNDVEGGSKDSDEARLAQTRSPSCGPEDGMIP